jgi:hypothetical protein
VRLITSFVVAFLAHAMLESLDKRQPRLPRFHLPNDFQQFVELVHHEIRVWLVAHARAAGRNRI